MAASEFKFAIFDASNVAFIASDSNQEMEATGVVEGKSTITFSGWSLADGDSLL